jgi:hypothetical protein
MATQDEQMIAQQIHRQLLNMFQVSSSYVNSMKGASDGTDAYTKSINQSNTAFSNHTKQFKESSQVLKDFNRQLQMGGNNVFKTITALGGLEKKLNDFKIKTNKFRELEDQVDKLGKNLGGVGSQLGDSFKTLKTALGDVGKAQWEKVLMINEFNKKLQDAKDHALSAGYTTTSEDNAALRALDTSELNKTFDKVASAFGNKFKDVDSLSKQALATMNSMSAATLNQIDRRAAVLKHQNKISDEAYTKISATISNDISSFNAAKLTHDFKISQAAVDKSSGAISQKKYDSIIKKADSQLNDAITEINTHLEILATDVLQQGAKHIFEANADLDKSIQQAYRNVNYQNNQQQALFDTLNHTNNETVNSMRAAFSQINETAASVYHSDWNKISTELPDAFNASIKAASDFNASITANTTEEKIAQANRDLHNNLKTLTSMADVTTFEHFISNQSALVDELSSHIAKFGNTIDPLTNSIPDSLQSTMDSFLRLGHELKNTTPAFETMRQKIKDIQAGRKDSITGEHVKIDIDELQQLLNQNAEFLKVTAKTNTNLINQQFRFGNQMMSQLSPGIQRMVGIAQEMRNIAQLRRSGNGDEADARSAELMQQLNTNIQSIPQALRQIWGNTSGYMVKEFDALTNAIETERFQQIWNLELPEGEYQKLFAQNKQVWATTAEGQEGMNKWLADNQQLLKSTFGSDSSLYTGIGFTLREIQKVAGMSDQQVQDMIKTMRTTAKSTGLNNVAIAEMTNNLLKSNEFQQMEMTLSKQARAAKIKEIQATISYLGQIGMSEDGVKKFTEGLKESYKILSPQQYLKNKGQMYIIAAALESYRATTERVTGTEIKGTSAEDSDKFQQVLDTLPANRTDEQNKFVIDYMTQLVNEKNTMEKAVAAKQSQVIEALAKAKDKNRADDVTSLENEERNLTAFAGAFATQQAELISKLTPDLQKQFAAIEEQVPRINPESGFNTLPENATLVDAEKTAKERETAFDKSLSLYQTTGLELVTEIDKISKAFKDSLWGGIIGSAGGLFSLAAQAIQTAASLRILGAGGAGGAGGAAGAMVRFLANPYVLGAVVVAIAGYMGWKYFTKDDAKKEDTQNDFKTATDSFVAQLHKTTKDLTITKENAVEEAKNRGLITKEQYDLYNQKQDAVKSGKLKSEQEEVALTQMDAMLRGFTANIATDANATNTNQAPQDTKQPITPPDSDKKGSESTVDPGYKVKPFPKTEEQKPIEPIQRKPIEDTGYKVKPFPKTEEQKPIEPIQRKPIQPITPDTVLVEKPKITPSQQLDGVDLQALKDQITDTINTKLDSLSGLAEIIPAIRAIGLRMEKNAEFFEKWWDRYNAVTPLYVKIPDISKKKDPKNDRDPK